MGITLQETVNVAGYVFLFLLALVAIAIVYHSIVEGILTKRSRLVKEANHHRKTALAIVDMFIFDVAEKYGIKREELQELYLNRMREEDEKARKRNDRAI